MDASVLVMESTLESTAELDQKKPAHNARLEARMRARAGSAKAQARSRISNGLDILPNVDGRSTIARRYRDISYAIVSDMGGADMCSESRLQLIRRFAAAAVIAEQMESRLARGEQISVERHCLLSSTLVRIAHRIGIERQARDVSPEMRLYEQELARFESEDAA
jgi:hypothetical protein